MHRFIEDFLEYQQSCLEEYANIILYSDRKQQPMQEEEPGKDSRYQVVHMCSKKKTISQQWAESLYQGDRVRNDGVA